MAGKGGYSIVITAVDNATGTIDKLNKRIEGVNKRVAQARAPFDNLGKSLQKFADVSGITKIATGFSDMARGGLEAFRSITRVVEPLAAITGAASIAGMYKLVTAWASFGLQLSQQANRAGTSAESLLQLQNAARLVGVSAESLTRNLTTLQDNLRTQEFANGPFTTAMKTLHLDFGKLREMKPAELMEAIGEALNKFPKAADRAYFAQQLGLNEDLLPLLQKGRDGIRGLLDAVMDYSKMSPDQIEKAKALYQAQELLVESTESLGRAIAYVLGPVVTPLLDDLRGTVDMMRRWVEVNHDWLGQQIDSKVKAVVDWFKSIDWDRVGTEIGTIATAFGHVGAAVGDTIVWLDKMGLASTALGLLIGAKLLGPLAGVITKLVWLGGYKLPAWLASLLGVSLAETAVLASPLLLSGDSAHNSEADLARNTLVEEQTRDYINGRKFGQGGMNSRDSGTPSYAPGQSGGIPAHISAHTAASDREGAKDTIAYLMSKGWSRAAAIGMSANIEQESHFDPLAAGDKVNGIATAHGMAQWHSGRLKDVEGHEGMGYAQMNRHQQLDGLDWEFRNKYPALFAQVQQQTSGAQAGGMISKGYLRPGIGPAAQNQEAFNRAAIAARQEADGLAPQGDPQSLPNAPAMAGAPGANGRVDLNVKVTGQPAQVTTRTQGDINVAQPGMIF